MTAHRHDDDDHTSHDAPASAPSQAEKSAAPQASSSPQLLAYFQERLEHALGLLRADASDPARSYLLHLLARYVRLDPDGALQRSLGFERPAALLLGEASERAPTARLEAYRELGDACLYNCGFFTERLTRRSLSQQYYERIGQQAYQSVSELATRSKRAEAPHSSWSMIFEELAAKFSQFVAALRHLATGKDPREQLFARIRRGEHVSQAELLSAGVLIGLPLSQHA